ncbi:MAG TPA: NFACT family protein, partial [Thermoplasmata archaeon]|nr:NFACT family protein [Thermoplasmata archaeon]
MGNEPTTIVKDRFTALDTLALSRELRALQGARVDKVFDVPPNGFSIAFRIPRAGRPQLLLVPGRYAALVPDTARAENLSPLARELRRLLTGCRLGLAHALGGERFLEVEFEGARGDPPALLVVELFGAGNLLVVNDGRIVAVQHVKTWAHRTVRIGATYERPPTRLDPWKATVAEIEAVLSASRTDRATTVAARLSLGGPVAEELLVRAGLEGSAPATTEPDRSAIALKDAIEELLSAVGERPTGHLYRRDELWIDVEPFSSERLRRDPSIVEEPRPSFSEAARLYFDSLVPTGPPVPDPEALARAELLRQRDQMALAVEDLSREAKRLTEDAELLLARFPEADALRSEAERQDPEGRGPIELSLDGRRIRVQRDRPLRESAQALFEESKRVRVKLEGARAALGTTEAKMASGRALAESRSGLAPSTPVRRTLRFERYRRFHSSEGVLVI